MIIQNLSLFNCVDELRTLAIALFLSVEQTDKPQHADLCGRSKHAVPRGLTAFRMLFDFTKICDDDETTPKLTPILYSLIGPVSAMHVPLLNSPLGNKCTPIVDAPMLLLPRTKNL